MLQSRQPQVRRSSLAMTPPKDGAADSAPPFALVNSRRNTLHDATRQVHAGSAYSIANYSFLLALHEFQRADEEGHGHQWSVVGVIGMGVG
jgi:hypothetical protein